MTIESQLERIAVATEKNNTLIEALLGKFDHIGQAVAPTTVGAQNSAATAQEPEVAAPPAAASTVAEAPKQEVPAAPVSASTVPAAPTTTAEVAAPPASMTVEQLNEALVAEYNRLGGTPDQYQRIAAEMQKLGATGVGELKPEQYSVLITAVKALA